MRFVPIKTRIRVLLSELGIVLPLEAAVIRGQEHKHLEELPRCCNTVIGDAVSELTHLDARFHEYDKHIAHIVKEDEQSRQLMQLGGIGPTTIVTIEATVGKGHDFNCGRQFCAWLKLVPSQYSSSLKNAAGAHTRAGDSYLPILLIMGAKAELSATKNKTNP